MPGSRASARPMRMRSPGGAGSEPAAVVQPVAEIAVAALVPAAPPVHGGDELDEAPVGDVDAGGHVGDGAPQSGGVVGDEVELWVCLQAGTVGAFGIELGVVRGFFGRLEHRLVTSSEVMRLILYIVPVYMLFVIVLFENIQTTDPG